MMNKMDDESYNLIEKVALKRVGGRLEVDALTLLFTKVNAMT